MRRIWTLLVMIVAGCSSAAAQRTQAEIATRLVGAPLLLRGFWTADTLKFDGAGQPKEYYAAGPFTVAAFDAKSVKLDGNHLVIEGQRVGIEFEEDGTALRIPLKTGRLMGSSENMKIEIDAGGNADFGPALDAVFADKLSQIAAALPAAWQYYAHKNLLHEMTPAPAVADGKPLHIGGTVVPPAVLKLVDPTFTKAARSTRFNGNALVYLIVDEDGVPSDMSIRRPLGLGLDEKAIEAISQYRFKPSMRDGEPMNVDLSIAVNFQIF
jgi:TonB family protein